MHSPISGGWCRGFSCLTLDFQSPQYRPRSDGLGRKLARKLAREDVMGCSLCSRRLPVRSAGRKSQTAPFSDGTRFEQLC